MGLPTGTLVLFATLALQITLMAFMRPISRNRISFGKPYIRTHCSASTQRKKWQGLQRVGAKKKYRSDAFAKPALSLLTQNPHFATFVVEFVRMFRIARETAAAFSSGYTWAFRSAPRGR